jgi:hypothetical protein
MIGPGSRYAGCQTLYLTTKDGYTVGYLARRPVPLTSPAPVLAEVVVTQGTRLDLIAARWLGDATKSWAVADANPVELDPFALTDRLGRRLKVAPPQA